MGRLGHNLGSLAYEHTVYECDKCGETECGHPGTLRDLGWIVREARPTGKPWRLVLCRDCNPPPELWGYRP